MFLVLTEYGKQIWIDTAARLYCVSICLAAVKDARHLTRPLTNDARRLMLLIGALLLVADIGLLDRCIERLLVRCNRNDWRGWCLLVMTLAPLD